MSAPTTIRVTQDHIDRGAPQSEGSCPIALALKEQWGEPFTEVTVTYEGASVYTENGWYSADTWPTQAIAFIERFDDLEDTEPLEFTVAWYFHDADGVTS